MKRLATLLLLFCMLISFVACGQTSKPDNSKPTDQTSITDNNEATTTPDASTTPIFSLEKIICAKDGKEYIYNVTYEADGIHVTPEILVGVNIALYNADGNILSELIYNDEGINTKSKTYSYNDAAQLTEVLTWDVKENCETNCATYSYNDQGQLLKGEHSTQGLITDYREYIYDANGFLNTEHSYGLDSVLRERYEYASDSNGRIQSCRVYKAQSKDKPLQEWGCYTYTYDSEGRLLGKAWEATNSNLGTPASYYYTYDENGNVTSVKEMYAENVFKTRNYSYNENGNLVSFTDDDGTVYTFVYAELKLSKGQADMASSWSGTGIINAFVEDPN